MAPTTNPNFHPSMTPFVLESIPPVPCTVCGEPLRYGVCEMLGGVHEHRVLVLIAYTNEYDQPRPVNDLRGLPVFWYVPLVEADLPEGTLLRHVDDPTFDRAVVVICGPGLD